jgi:hypothetical protein
MLNMSKLTEREKLFEYLKDCILTLEKHRQEFKQDSDIITKWNENSIKVLKEIELLNEEDRQWMSEQYREWFKSLPKENWDLELIPKTI